MKKILIISTSMMEQAMLEEVMIQHHPGTYEIETTGSFGQKAEWWVANSPDALIVRLPADEFLQNFFFSKLKSDVPKHISILFICEIVSAGLMQMTTQFQKVRIIKMPVEAFDLYRGLGDLLAEHAPGKQQASPRYMTDQPIVVTSDFKSGKMEAKLRNLSITGAFFESEKNTMGLAVSDLIRIQIIIPGTKEYVFDAKIVWARKKDKTKPHGFGCTFVDKNEVYENLLKGI